MTITVSCGVVLVASILMSYDVFNDHVKLVKSSDLSEANQITVRILAKF
jgi:hypothetical protein